MPVADRRGPAPLAENRRDLLENGITFNKNLPIAALRENILCAIRASPTVLVHGATGCGKTTQIPQYILGDCASRGHMPYIVVTQPRRIAAISIARHVCEERNWEFGGLVGYQIGQDSLCHPEETRILYCTLGVFLEKLASGKGLDQMSHVVLDEMHEREEEMDLALLLMKKLQQGARRHVKLIVMSATMDIDKFEAYLGRPPVIEIATGMFGVEVKYLEDITATPTSTYDFQIQEPKIDFDVQKELLNLVASFDELEKKTEITSKGVVLIFVPGLREIVELMKALEEIRFRKNQNWKILPLHSTVSRLEQDRVFAPCLTTVRRIIVSTNIAESSVTIPDVKYVIDLCLTKQLTRDEFSAFTALRLTWASKSNCEQRKGRAGRLSTGTVYRMVPRWFYEELTEHAMPEMLRIPLHQTILKVKTLNFLGSIYEILLEAVDPPAASAIRQSVLELLEAGALSLSEQCTDHERPDGNLTSIGRIMSTLPLDLPLARLIILGVSFGCVDEAVIIAGCLQSRSFLDVKFLEQNSQSFRMKMVWDRGGHSDLLAVLTAFQTWECQKTNVFGKKTKFFGEKTSFLGEKISFYENNSNVFENNSSEERKWCQSFSLNCTRINQAAVLVDELRRRVQSQGLYALYLRGGATAGTHSKVSKWCLPETDGDEDVDQRTVLQFVIAGAFYPNYFIHERIEKQNELKNLAPPELATVFLSINVDERRVSPEGVRDFFHEHIGYVPVEVKCEEMRVFVTFRQGGEGQGGEEEQEAPLPVYLALRLRQEMDRESGNTLRKVIEPPKSAVPAFVPRAVALTQKPSVKATAVKQTRVEFSGPYSEVEVSNFTAVTPDVKLRRVRVAKSSVNSVVISAESCVTRVLVAATVKASETSGCLLIDNTTLLPALPGFFDLINLVFAPSMRLLIPTAHRYRAGVGKTKTFPPLSLWRDHDIEREFEVEFTEKQLEIILLLREKWAVAFSDRLMKDARWRHLLLPKVQHLNRRMLHFILSQNCVSV